MEITRIQNNQTMLIKKKNVGGLKVTNFKIYSNATEIEFTNRSMKQNKAPRNSQAHIPTDFQQKQQVILMEK